MTGLTTWTRRDRHARPKAYVVVLVCLALLVLLPVIQVAHVHPVTSDADHCPLCIALQTAAPVAIAAAAIVLVQVETFAPAVEVRPLRSTWQQQLFIRPPPSI